MEVGITELRELFGILLAKTIETLHLEEKDPECGNVLVQQQQARMLTHNNK